VGRCGDILLAKIASRLTVFQESGRIGGSHLVEVELFNFEPTVLPSGNLRCQAAGAYHDDMVMALSLAWSAREGQNKPWAEAFRASAIYSPSLALSDRGWHKL
jgi:hypothetical protein